MDEQFYRDAFRRIDRFFLAFALLGVILCALLYTTLDAFGFAVGTVVAWLSYLFLKRFVNALEPGAETSTGAQVFGIVFRYTLIAVVVFAMMKNTGMSPWPVFAGLATTVAAVLAEIVYELVTSS